MLDYVVIVALKTFGAFSLLAYAQIRCLQKRKKRQVLRAFRSADPYRWKKHLFSTNPNRGSVLKNEEIRCEKSFQG